MARKKPDKLAQDVSKAIVAGMSYGKWKAMQEPMKPKEEIPEGWKVCPWCGKAFKPVCGQVFCEPNCKAQAYSQKTYDIQTEKVKRWGTK